MGWESLAGLFWSHGHHGRRVFSRRVGHDCLGWCTRTDGFEARPLNKLEESAKDVHGKNRQKGCKKQLTSTKISLVISSVISSYIIMEQNFTTAQRCLEPFMAVHGPQNAHPKSLPQWIALQAVPRAYE